MKRTLDCDSAINQLRLYKIAAVLLMTFLNAFSWAKMLELLDQNDIEIDMDAIIYTYIYR